jgi:hypothetical protein
MRRLLEEEAARKGRAFHGISVGAFVRPRRPLQDREDQHVFWMPCGDGSEMERGSEAKAKMAKLEAKGKVGGLFSSVLYLECLLPFERLGIRIPNSWSQGAYIG